MNKIRDNRKRAKTATILFWVMLAFTPIIIALDFMEYHLLHEMRLGVTPDDETANANDARQGMVGIMQLALLGATSVTFIMWFRRAYNNLHNLGIHHLSYTEGWAAGSWFVPFLNLVRPYTIMKEIWEETQLYISSEAERYKLSFSTSLIGWWWGLFLFSNILSNVSGRIVLGADGVNDLITASTISLIANVVNIPAIVLTILLIQKTAVYENALYEKAKANPDIVTIDD